MKTHKNLYPKIYSFENLLNASKKAQKGKRFKENTARFNVNLENELIQLQKELKEKTYRPGPYTTFFVHEPKKRMISAAPYRDRVVHHALCNVIEPIFERTFIFDSYANRKEKGTHRAVLRYQQFSRKNRYVLKCDIQKFFASMDHEVMKHEIRRKIADRETLWLIETIIDYSNEQEGCFDYFLGDDLFTPFSRRRGIPIGNLTSQFFANVYLNGFDHFIKEQIGCKYYVRYVDDWAVFHDDKQFLHRVKKEAECFLSFLRLKLHSSKSKVFPVSTGLEFLGHRIFPEFKLLKKENVVRFKRRMRKYQRLYQERRKEWDEIQKRIQSWNAHAGFSDTYRLRQKIFNEFTFQRGTV